ASMRNQIVVAPSDQRTHRPRSTLAATGALNVIVRRSAASAAEASVALTGAAKPSTWASPIAAAGGDDGLGNGSNAAQRRASAMYGPPAWASARTASIVA